MDSIMFNSAGLYADHDYSKFQTIFIEQLTGHTFCYHVNETTKLTAKKLWGAVCKATQYKILHQFSG